MKVVESEVVEPLNEEATPKETLNGKVFKYQKIPCQHWLFNHTPFKFKVEKETDCSKCQHKNVCSRNMDKVCMNFEYGSGGHDARPNSCDVCMHHYERYDKDNVPCFKCRFFNTIDPICPNCGKELVLHVEKENDIITKLYRDCSCGYKKVEF